MKNILLLLVIGLLASCANNKMDEYSCLTTNMYQQGMTDGQKGEPMRPLAEAQMECASHGIKINTKQYVEGWQEGMEQFCTPGYQLGLHDAQANLPRRDFSEREKNCKVRGPGLNQTH